MNEPFEIEGFWWLPDTPEARIPGVLSHSPGDTPRLRLMGALNQIADRDFPPPDFINPDIIQGMTAKGEPVTLSKCLQRSSKSNIGGVGSFYATEFIAHLAFIGIHFSAPTEIKFKNVQFCLHNLDNWYNKKCIQTEMPDPSTEVITYHRPGSIDIQINDYVVRIAILENLEHSQNKVSLSANVYINLIYPEEKLFTEFLNLLRPIQNFFTFATSKPTFVIEMSGIVTENISPATDTNFIQPSVVKIFFAAVGWQPKPSDVFWASMLLPYSKIEDELPDLLCKWVEKSGTLKPVFDLYFADFYQPTYLENEFLNLTQAIETYHRRVFGGQYLPEDEFLRGVYQSLVAAIPKNIPDDFRSSLKKGKLRYAHEYSLRKRILLLCEHISQNLQVNFLPDKKAQSSFAEKIANTRNYLTHYSPELKEKAITDGKGLFEMNNQLSLILIYCIFEQLGMTSQKIEEILRSDKRYQGYFTEK